IVEDGTSLSAPLVSGAVAVVKAARPKLTVDQYRSLVINSASAFPDGSSTIDVLQTGAGLLNLSAAVTTNTAVTPTSVSFGQVKSSDAISRDLTIMNLGSGSDTFQVALNTNDGTQPQLSQTSFTIAGGGSAKLTLNFTPSATAGQYQGFLVITSGSGHVARVPSLLRRSGKGAAH